MTFYLLILLITFWKSSNLLFSSLEKETHPQNEMSIHCWASCLLGTTPEKKEPSGRRDTYGGANTSPKGQIGQSCILLSSLTSWESILSAIREPNKCFANEAHGNSAPKASDTVNASTILSQVSFTNIRWWANPTGLPEVSWVVPSTFPSCRQGFQLHPSSKEKLGPWSQTVPWSYLVKPQYLHSVRGCGRV